MKGFDSKEISKTGLNNSSFSSDNQLLHGTILGTSQPSSLLLEITRITHPTFDMRLSRFPAL